MNPNKKRLKTLLKEMLRLAKKGDSEGVYKINTENFSPFFTEVFGEMGGGKKASKEEMNYDKARNNILYSLTEPLSKYREKRQEFLKVAQGYIDMLD